MMKNIVAIPFFLISTSAFPETLSFPSFQIEIQNDWAHRIEPAPGDDAGRVIRIHGPSAIGTLSLRALDAPNVVSAEALRNLTNLEESIDLAWESWGEYSGYQFNYVQDDTYFRHWWLAHERTILVISYDCEPALKDIEAEEIDRIVGSITVNDSETR
jgi:ABC-type Fe2+-enterobactin transport system substrate-binding protein